jgi:arabinan endo-1,5-alpha-L-arabinosidase
LVQEPVFVLENDLEWEGHLIEGVWVTKHDDKFYLFYSGNDFSTAEYGVGVAVADAPLGPYRKAEHPLFRSTADWSGPGHPSVVYDLNGEPRLFLHAFFPGRAGYKEFRALLSARIAFEDDQVMVREGT